MIIIKLYYDTKVKQTVLAWLRTKFISKESFVSLSFEVLAHNKKSLHCIVLGMVLGQGAFGRVIKAEAIGIQDSEDVSTVAVKMVKGKSLEV